MKLKCELNGERFVRTMIGGALDFPDMEIELDGRKERISNSSIYIVYPTENIDVGWTDPYGEHHVQHLFKTGFAVEEKFIIE